MRWLLAGCCGLALISLSVALQLSQKPRFYGVKTKRTVGIYCMSSKQNLLNNVEWYKADTYNTENRDLIKGSRYTFHNRTEVKKAFLYIHGLEIKDSGVYFCKVNNTWGPGTEVQVVNHVNLQKAEYRSKMKDGLIVLQGLLLAVCIAAVLLRNQKLVEKKHSEYEEPETDHIYEGLAIETCGGDLYEELTVYAQADGTEAPWE